MAVTAFMHSAGIKVKIKNPGKKKRHPNRWNHRKAIAKTGGNKMIAKHKQMRLMAAMIIMITCAALASGKGNNISFKDSFENGLTKWDVSNPFKCIIIESGDVEHGNVLALYAGGAGVYALIKGSDRWTNIGIEGDMYFPSYYPHQMGLVYNFNIKETRAHFGCVYVYGPLGENVESFLSHRLAYALQPPDKFIGNVIAAQPHRDGMTLWIMDPEYWVVLEADKDACIKPREWHHFKAEIAGPVCHFYVDDMKIPKITYSHFEYSSGRVGFKPIYTGGECWIDNITVNSLKELSYKGPILPAGIHYKPEKLLTRWDAIGPFYRRSKELEDDGYLPEKTYFNEHDKLNWRPFEADARGCVISAKIFGKFDLKFYSYYHTEIFSPSQKEVTLEFSSTNKMVVWVNDRRVGAVNGRQVIWYDFRENPRHKGARIKATLKPGKNHLLVAFEGAIFGGDGFFACCNMGEEDREQTGSKDR
jgi:hypothetical protein